MARSVGVRHAYFAEGFGVKYTFKVSGDVEAKSHDDAYNKIREAVVLADIWLDNFALSIEQKAEPSKVGFRYEC